MYSIQTVSKALVKKTISIDTIDTKLTKLDQALKLKASTLLNFLESYLQQIEALPRAAIASAQTINKVIACVNRNLSKIEDFEIESMLSEEQGEDRNQINLYLDQLQTKIPDPFHASFQNRNTDITNKRGIDSLDSPSLINKKQKIDEIDDNWLLMRKSSGKIHILPKKPEVIQKVEIYPAYPEYFYDARDTIEDANFCQYTIIDSDLKFIIFDQPNLDYTKIKSSRLESINFYTESNIEFDLQGSKLDNVSLEGYAFATEIGDTINNPQRWGKSNSFNISNTICKEVIINLIKFTNAKFNELEGSLNMNGVRVGSSQMQQMKIRQSKWTDVELRKGTVFSNNILQNMMLENCIFSNIDATYNKIISTKIIGDNESEPNINNSNLNNLTIQDSVLGSIFISNCKLDNCTLTKTMFENSRLSNCTATRSKLENVSFQYGLEDYSEFSFLDNINLSNSDISAIKIGQEYHINSTNELNFSNSVINVAELYSLTIENSQFYRSRINSLLLYNALVKNTGFSEVKLNNSGFGDVIFSQCNLHKIEISNCRMMTDENQNSRVYITNMDCDYSAIEESDLDDMDDIDDNTFKEYFKVDDQYKPQRYEISIKDSDLNIRMDIDLAGAIENNTLNLSLCNSSHHNLAIKSNQLNFVNFNKTNFDKCQFLNNKIEDLIWTDFNFSKGIFSGLEINGTVTLTGNINFYQSQLEKLTILTARTGKGLDSDDSTVTITSSSIKQLTMVGTGEKEEDGSFWTEYSGKIILKEVTGADIVLKNMGITGDIIIQDSNLQLELLNINLSGSLTVVNSTVSLYVEDCKIKPACTNYKNTEFKITKRSIFVEYSQKTG